MSAGAGGGDAGGGDEEGDAVGLFVVGVLGPDAVVAEVVAVVAPEDDDGVLGEAGAVEFVEDPADLGVHVAEGGVVAVDELAGECLRRGGDLRGWACTG